MINLKLHMILHSSPYSFLHCKRWITLFLSSFFPIGTQQCILLLKRVKHYIHVHMGYLSVLENALNAYLLLLAGSRENIKDAVRSG